MTFVAGIDMGAKSTKAVVMDGEKRICAKASVKTRPDFAAVAREVLDLALQRAGITEKEHPLHRHHRLWPLQRSFPRRSNHRHHLRRARRGISLSQDPLRSGHRRAEHKGASGQRHR